MKLYKTALFNVHYIWRWRRKRAEEESSGRELKRRWRRNLPSNIDQCWQGKNSGKLGIIKFESHARRAIISKGAGTYNILLGIVTGRLILGASYWGLEMKQSPEDCYWWMETGILILGTGFWSWWRSGWYWDFEVVAGTGVRFLNWGL